MGLSNSQIEQWFSDNYSQHFRYDELKIKRHSDRFGNKMIDVKVMDCGVKIGWGDYEDDDNFFARIGQHFDWQFCIKRQPTN